LVRLKGDLYTKREFCGQLEGIFGHWKGDLVRLNGDSVIRREFGSTCREIWSLEGNLVTGREFWSA
jgi:hypothetical protein